MEGPLVIKPRVFFDDRGHFFESYNRDRFIEAGLPTGFVQDNQSMSHKNAVRGLHFQAPPFAQGKLVRVVRGSVLDVIVDIRRSSPTYGQSFTIVLSEENFIMLWIPEGFAHGFSTLEDHTVFQYKCTNLYHKESEGGLLWNDPELEIDWIVKNPILSEKDHLHPPLSGLKSPFP